MPKLTVPDKLRVTNVRNGQRFSVMNAGPINQSVSNFRLTWDKSVALIFIIHKPRSNHRPINNYLRQCNAICDNATHKFESPMTLKRGTINFSSQVQLSRCRKWSKLCHDATNGSIQPPLEIYGDRLIMNMHFSLVILIMKYVQASVAVDIFFYYSFLLTRKNPGRSKRDFTKQIKLPEYID